MGNINTSHNSDLYENFTECEECEDCQKSFFCLRCVSCVSCVKCTDCKNCSQLIGWEKAEGLHGGKILSIILENLDELKIDIPNINKIFHNSLLLHPTHMDNGEIPDYIFLKYDKDVISELIKYRPEILGLLPENIRSIFNINIKSGRSFVPHSDFDENGF